MHSLLPPANQAGIPLPKTPQNPATFEDIGQAVQYLRALDWTRVGPHPNPATNREIGEAEVYKTSLILSCMFGPTAPPWLAGLRAHIQNVQAATDADLRNDTNAIRSTDDTALLTDDEQQITSHEEALEGGSGA
ncbi:hypothetical protein NLJ89_g6099 [Agrocybe chaxingu]|uniref:Uncharacterized protein n=1 Tax=Agrocybe chaxingu TaxID=84603 RepID=A0A9W8MUE0_9AGAR|nr:hypothetical protein NLJ89_g6099 [Agrocybe chaxingu]